MEANKPALGRQEMFFGKFVNEKRIEKEITLRTFCKLINYDPSSWSKIERGIADAPKRGGFLNTIAYELKLSEQDRLALFLLAACDNIIHNAYDGALDKLPLFVSKKTNLEKLYNLIKTF